MDNNDQEKLPANSEPKIISPVILRGGLAVGIIVVLVGIIFFTVRYARKLNDAVYAPSQSDIPSLSPGFDSGESGSVSDSSNQPGVVESISLEVQTDGFGKYVQRYEVTKDYTPEFPAGSIAVDWHKGAIPLSHGEVATIIKNIDPTIKNNQLLITTTNDIAGEHCLIGSAELGCQMHIYDAGTFTQPASLKGRTVYLVYIPNEWYGNGKPNSFNIATLDPTTHTFITFVDPTLLDNTDSANTIEPGIDAIGFQSGVVGYTFTDLQAPDTLSVTDSSGNSVTLSFAKYAGNTNTAPFDRGGVLNVFEHKVDDLASYMKSDVIFEHAIDQGREYGPVYFKNGGYNIILPDGSVKMYDILPYFFVKNTDTPSEAAKNFYPNSSQVDITWTDGREQDPNEAYVLGGTIGSIGMCQPGVVPCTNIVNGQPWFEEWTRIPVGKTKKGDFVFELAQTERQNPFYKALFDFGYDGWKVSTNIGWFADNSMTEKQKYQDFLNDHPLFFWQDQFGHWRVYQKAHYVAIVECGKPVIYLYPEHETTVRVAVRPTGGLTKTDPIYGDVGWEVRANTGGILTNLADGKTYPYLFWEGIASDYERPQEGFLLSRENVAVQMQEILGKLGLNEKERKDFLEFWQAKLTVKPYVFVTFVPKTQFDVMAPLEVVPAPDTVIRVFMDYEPLDKPIVVKPMVIKTPERKGFTVVEWGGALHYNF